jgi:hypothetical protein
MDFAVVSNTDTDIAQYRYCPKGCKASAIVRISSAYGMTNEPTFSALFLRVAGAFASRSRLRLGWSLVRQNGGKDLKPITF